MLTKSFSTTLLLALALAAPAAASSRALTAPTKHAAKPAADKATATVATTAPTASAPRATERAATAQPKSAPAPRPGFFHRAASGFKNTFFGQAKAKLASVLAKPRMAVRTASVKARFRVLDLRDRSRTVGGLFHSRVAGLLHRVQSSREEEPQYSHAIFHFINGRNNLEGYAQEDLNEIVEGSKGDPNTVHVVEMSTLKDPVARRYMIVNGTKKELAPAGTVDFGNPNDAYKFFEWGLTAKNGNKPMFAAKQYDFSLWDHGGAVGGDMYDEKTGNHFNLSQYGQVFPQTDKAGLHIADFCLGGNIEHMAEIYAGTRSKTPGAHIYVASEETEPGEGHDYIGAGKLIAKNPNASLAQQGKLWVKSYIDSYSTGKQKQDVQSAALDVDGVANLLPRMRVFSKELIAAANAGEKNTLMNDASQTQHFYFASQRDLYDFARLVAQNTQRPSLKTAANEIMDYVKDKVVIANQTTPGDTRYQNSHGLAIWLPTESSVAQDTQRLESFNGGTTAPPGYDGFRAPMLPASAIQSIARGDDYQNTAFAKLVPEWVQFTKMLSQ